jgi:cellulose synthase/poly-beta-1,6-N-acetylglucosamine synthase-like glycosyltransferase
MRGPFFYFLADTELETTAILRKITVGICATGRSGNLPALLDLVISERSETFEISKVVVVASHSFGPSLGYARQLASREKRLILIEEPVRLGKADAINKILENSSGDYLVFINSDALPEAGAIAKLFHHICSEPRFGIVSASPVLEAGSRPSAISSLERLIWSTHNESSLELNHLGLSNHTSDEMMIIRSNLLERLPKELVNDGAFLASKIKSRGFLVGFSKTARVRISVPSRVPDLISQRRRIIFGHFQVRFLVGVTPLSVESLLFRSPSLSFRIVARTISSSPHLLFVLPLAIFTESVSAFLALMDVAGSSKRHAVWKRYES